MKMIKTKYLSFIRRLGKLPFSLILALALVMVLAVASVAADTYTEVWDGTRGMDSWDCEIKGEDDPRNDFVDTGWIHWVFSTKGRSTDARLTLGGTGEGEYEPGHPLNANVWHFYTPYFELEGLTAIIEILGGKPGRGGGLVISDWCPGEFESLDVSKTAVTSFTREHFWDISKIVETEEGDFLEGVPKIWLDQPLSGQLPPAEIATWFIEVTYEDYEDSGWNVSGDITILNDGQLPAVITDVEDELVLADEAEDPIPVDVDCGDITFPYTLPVGGTLTCTYSEDVDGEIEGFNEVTVTTERFDYFAEAEIEWGEPDPEINKTVNIKDISELFGDVDLGSVTAPDGATFDYSETFEWDENFCGQSFTYENTAMIVGTEHEAEAILKVNIRCEDLLVTKEVFTYYERTHKWDIAKMVETENEEFLDGVPKIWLYADGSGDETATWKVDVTYKGYEDSDFKVSGNIYITNDGQLDAEITSVVDVLGDDLIDVIVDCNVTFPYTLPVEVEGTNEHILTCSYSKDVDSKIEGNNVVTVTTTRDTYSANAPIVWGEPDKEHLETVNIKDISILFGTLELGEVTAPNNKQFTYDKLFAWGDYDPYLCEIPYTYTNTATIVETEQSASATLKVNVQCLIFKGETAWAANGNQPLVYPYNPDDGGNWATYVKYAEKTTYLFAGQTIHVGSVTFSAVVDSKVTITVALNAPWEFEGVYENLKVQDYAEPPSGNPAPGQFDHKITCSSENGLCSIVVPANNYYGVHVNVGWWMPDPNFGP